MARLNVTITIHRQFYPDRIYLTMPDKISSQITQYKSFMEDFTEFFVLRQKENTRKLMYCLDYPN